MDCNIIMPTINGTLCHRNNPMNQPGLQLSPFITRFHAKIHLVLIDAKLKMHRFD